MKIFRHIIHSSVSPQRRLFNLRTIMSLTAAIIANALSAYAVTAADAFVKMPRQDLDILTISMRQDMIDYMQADSVVHKRNVFLGESWIEKMTDNYIRVHLTDASDIQLKVLPLAKGDNQIVMSIYTVTADNGTSDSTLKFFNEEMTELPRQQFFSLPNPRDFYDFSKDEKSGKKIDKKEIYNLMPFYTIKYDITPDSDLLQGTLTMSDFLTLEQKAKVEKYLHPEMAWLWTGKKFKKQ